MNTEDSEFQRLEHEALLRASQPKHHTLQQRPWVGLTEEEQIQVAFACGCMSSDWLDFARAIEFKLKERNR